VPEPLDSYALILHGPIIACHPSPSCSLPFVSTSHLGPFLLTSAAGTWWLVQESTPILSPTLRVLSVVEWAGGRAEGHSQLPQEALLSDAGMDLHSIRRHD